VNRKEKINFLVKLWIFVLTVLLVLETLLLWTRIRDFSERETRPPKAEIHECVRFSCDKEENFYKYFGK
jgi:hypothetical protein